MPGIVLDSGVVKIDTVSVTKGQIRQPQYRMEHIKVKNCPQVLWELSTGPCHSPQEETFIHSLHQPFTIYPLPTVCQLLFKLLK